MAAVRLFHALLIMLLALSSMVPHRAIAAVPAPHAAATHHGARHAPTHDCGGCATSCIGCAVPDAPFAVVMPAAFVPLRALSAFVPQSPRGHATALDPPPPNTA